MDLNTYQQEIKRTLANLGSLKEDLSHMAMGISGEIFEFSVAGKVFHNDPTEKNKVELSKELGDIFWYLINIGNIVEFQVEPLQHSRLFEECIIDVVEPIKKHCAYGKELPTKFNDNINRLVYSLTSLANSFELNVEDIYQLNIDKLKARYPDKFVAELAINKDELKEQKIIENE